MSVSSSHWDRRYDTDDYVFGTEPSPFLVRCADVFAPGMSALSLADGEGRNGVWLAEQALNVTTMDCSERALDKARRLAESRGTVVRTVCGDLAAWAWEDAAFDVVLAMNFHFPESLRLSVFRGCARTLKPGGYLVLEGLHKDTRDHHDPETLYDEATVRALMPSLRILRLETGEVARDGEAKKKIHVLYRKD